MRFSLGVAALALALSLLPVGCASPPDGGEMDRTLTVIDYNLWHGLNPVGLLKFDEFETPAERELRLEGFLAQARALQPDLIFLQEVNPVPGLSARIADELGMQRVFQVGNSGIKIGSLGPPINLRSGLAILAAPQLHLEKLDGCKLSGSTGRCGPWLSIQTGEFRYALVARVEINGRELMLINTHLHHGMEIDQQVRQGLDELVDKGTITREQADAALAEVALASQRRRSEIERALDCAADAGLDQSTPVLFAGDFNASPDAPELTWLKSHLGFASVTDDSDPQNLLYTWDPQRNSNTLFVSDFKPPSDGEGLIFAHLGQTLVHQRRRLDYIFTRSTGSLLEPRESGLFADQPRNGTMSSDHFGVFAKFEIK
ncbi:MAG: endonuclease/exonuclease/phosphatase family protein [Candidatus Alcyoniella australis]|nr:endonuclease/exonuclease/phosphatase family protein [Candidatus Alcyoniella australis]